MGKIHNPRDGKDQRQSGRHQKQGAGIAQAVAALYRDEAHLVNRLRQALAVTPASA